MSGSGHPHVGPKARASACEAPIGGKRRQWLGTGRWSGHDGCATPRARWTLAGRAGFMLISCVAALVLRFSGATRSPVHADGLASDKRRSVPARKLRERRRRRRAGNSAPGGNVCKQTFPHVLHGGGKGHRLRPLFGQYHVGLYGPRAYRIDQDPHGGKLDRRGPAEADDGKLSGQDNLARQDVKKWQAELLRQLPEPRGKEFSEIEQCERICRIIISMGIRGEHETQA